MSLRDANLTLQSNKDLFLAILIMTFLNFINEAGSLFLREMLHTEDLVHWENRKTQIGKQREVISIENCMCHLESMLSHGDYIGRLY